MAYRVRTPDGELTFASLYDIERAYAQGLVDENDEIREDGSEVWRKAGAIPAIRQARPEKVARRNFSPRLMLLTVLCAGLALQQFFFGSAIVAIALCLCASSLAMALTYKAFKK